MDEDQKPQLPENVEKELTAGKFTMQQLRTIGFVVGGLVGGFAIGKWGIAKIPGAAKKVGNWTVRGINDWVSSTAKMAGGDAKTLDVNAPEVVNAATNFSEHWIIPGATAIGGYIVGQVAALYEHWHKVEGERLSVQEINKDISGLMQKRVQFEETLNTQSKLVQDIIKKHEAGAGHIQQLKTEREQVASVEQVAAR